METRNENQYTERMNEIEIEIEMEMENKNKK